ncbi:MAG TPA: dockerin type I domain-containing protein [Bryobacteraceae bacterium]|nr:dockerin type I domain-containing protein [Bryobacteraceae bacterium]
MADETPPQLMQIEFQQPPGTTQLQTDLISPGLPVGVYLQTKSGSSPQGFDGYSGCNPSIQITSQNQFPQFPAQSSTQTVTGNFYRPYLDQPDVWQTTLTFPALSEIGQWNVFVSLCDRVGNYGYFSGPTTALQGNAFVYVLYMPNNNDGNLHGNSAGDVAFNDTASAASIKVPQCGGPGLPQCPVLTSGSGGSPVSSPVVSISTTPEPPSGPQCLTGGTGCYVTQNFTGFQATSSDFVSVTFTDPNCTASGQNNCSVQNATLSSGVSVTIPFEPGTPAVPPPVLQLVGFDNGTSHPVYACGPAGSTGALSYTLQTDTNGDIVSATFSPVCKFSTFSVLERKGVPGDLNNDGIVNCTDVNIVKSAYGTRAGQPTFSSQADVNNDGVVNILDLAFVSRLLPAGMVCK